MCNGAFKTNDTYVRNIQYSTDAVCRIFWYDPQIPRGRVAWNIDKFTVLAGHWAEPIHDIINELIDKYFHLPYFEFVYDEHWDLGHGWSGDM